MENLEMSANHFNVSFDQSFTNRCCARIYSTYL